MVWFGLKWGFDPYKGYVYVTYDQKLNGSNMNIPIRWYIPILGVLSSLLSLWESQEHPKLGRIIKGGSNHDETPKLGI